MATYKVPGQNLSFDIPEEGLFRMSDTGESLFYRSGNDIISIDPTKVRGDTRPDEYSNRGNAGDVAFQKALKEKYGINFSDVAYVDPNAMERFFPLIGLPSMGGVKKGGGVEYLTQKPTGSVTPNQVYTQGVSPTNPQGAQVTSSAGATTFSAPQSQAQAQGLTPQQVQQQVAATTQALTPEQSAAAVAAAGGTPAIPATATPAAQGVQGSQWWGQAPAGSGQQGTPLVPTGTPPGTTPGTPATPAAPVVPQQYTIQSGDSLSAIANRLGTSVGALMSANPTITDPNKIFAGQKLNLTPQPAAVAPKFDMSAVNATVERAKAMLAQENTPGQEGQPFAGSAWDTPEHNAVGSSLAEKGVTVDPQSASDLAMSNPLKFVSELYTGLIESMGLNSIKSKFEEYSKTLEDITNEKNDKIVDVNNNPWLSQGARDKQVQAISDKYSGRIDSATAQAKLMESMYQDGLQQAQYLTGQAVSVFNNAFDNQSAIAQKAMQLAADKAEAEAKTSIETFTDKEILTSSQRSALLAAGLKGSEIDNFANDVEDFGFDAAIDGVPATKKAAIQDAFGVERRFITADFLTKSFAGSNVDAMLKTLGKTRDDYKAFWQSASTEEAKIKADFQKYIKGPLMDLIELYRGQGMTDKEIMKMMQ